MKKLVYLAVPYFLSIVFFITAPVAVFAVDFIELTVDPRASGYSDADQVTLLINRSNITHVDINMTKTPENIWYKLIFHADQRTAEKEQGILFILECNSSEIVKAISSAIRNGDKNPINALESCRLTAL